MRVCLPRLAWLRTKIHKVLKITSPGPLKSPLNWNFDAIRPAVRPRHEGRLPTPPGRALVAYGSNYGRIEFQSPGLPKHNFMGSKLGLFVE